MGTLFHSGHIHMLARRAYERSLEHSWSSMESILLSAIAVECFINEFEETLSSAVLSGGTSRIEALSKTLELLEDAHAQVLTKLDAVHLGLRGTRLDKGGAMAQDLRFLFQLRNAFVHRRAESVAWGDETPQEADTHPFVKHLVRRSVISEPPEHRHTGWSQYVVVPPAARWAYNTSNLVAKAMISWLPPSHTRYVLQTMCADWVDIAA